MAFLCVLSGAFTGAVYSKEDCCRIDPRTGEPYLVVNTRKKLSRKLMEIIIRKETPNDFRRVLGDVKGGRFYESDIINDELSRDVVNVFDRQFL